MEFQELINKYGTLSRRDSMEKIAALEDQLAEEEHIRERMAHLLAETAVALKGPEEARKRHGWQDLPEAAASLRAEVEALRTAVANEREACALICDSVNTYSNPMTATDCADAIRARSVIYSGNSDASIFS